MRKQPGYTIFTTAIFGALALMIGSVAMAAPLTVPNTFTAGTPATAASVNANFGAVQTAVDDNDSRVTTNASGVAINTTGISGNTTTIGGNTTSIGTNTTNIGANTTGIGANTTAIGTNTTNIGDNFSSITGNTTNIGTNTTAIAGHETRITTLEAGGGGGGGVVATPVTINCPSAAGAIQTAIDTAAPVGRLTITINGICSENVDITRHDVTLVGGITGGSILGPNTTTAATISASQKIGLEITNLTIGGGRGAVLANIGSNFQITNSTIGNGTTAGSGITALGSIVRILGTTTINGGITPDESPGIDAVGNAVVQFVSGNTTVNAGNASSALSCELASTFIAGDLQSLPNLTVNGSGPGFAVDFVENCYLGMFNGTINGDMAFSMNSTLTLESFSGEGAVSVIGNTIIDSSSAALIDGDTVAITGGVTVQRSSALSLRGGATISGTLQVRASSGMDTDIAGTIGILQCETSTGSYLDIFPQSLAVATSYLVDGTTPTSGDFACGFIFP